MGDTASHFTTVFMAFFAIMNPIANAPLFVGLTEGLDVASRRKIALRAVLLAFVIVAMFTLLGRQIFIVFGITLPAFRITGGILVSLVGYHLLQGQESSVHTPTAEDNSRSRDAALGVAITPLALPILAGPGTIATAMNFAAESTLPEIVRVLSALALVCLLWMPVSVRLESRLPLALNSACVLIAGLAFVLNRRRHQSDAPDADIQTGCART